MCMETNGGIGLLARVYTETNGGIGEMLLHYYYYLRLFFFILGYVIIQGYHCYRLIWIATVEESSFLAYCIASFFLVTNSYNKNFQEKNF